MKSQSKSKKLYSILGMGNSQNPYPDGDLGVEVELEGSLYGHGNRLNYWTVKGEGSLRNGGMEYVLKYPVSVDMLPKVLSEFDMLMSKSKPLTTIRCSTHIHVSVLELTLTQIYNAMLAWYFVENLMVQTQSANRQGNLFCLRLSDAEEIAVSIRDSLERGDGIYTFHPERNRYAALNLCAITKFGSFEFRFLDAMTSGKDIERWCKILYSLVHNTKNISPEQLLAMYDQMSAMTFLSSLIGSQYVPFICKGLTPGQITRHLHANYDYIFEFAHELKKDKFELPRYMWNEDLEDPKKIEISSPFQPLTPDLVAEIMGTATNGQVIHDSVPAPPAPGWIGHAHPIIDDFVSPPPTDDYEVDFPDED